MTALLKIAVLEKAASGDLLTPDEEQTLRDCADDYRALIKLGNGFKVSKMLIVDAFDLIFDDVRYMVGSCRQRAIRILKLSGARGYRTQDLPIPQYHPTDERYAEELAVPVDPEEIREAG